MDTINERDYYLDKEKEIIRDLLLSKINNDGHTEILQLYLRQTMNVNNELVREYFDSRKEKDSVQEQSAEKPVKGLMNDSFYECFDKYIQLSKLKDQLSCDYKLEDDIEYRQKEMVFVTNYNISKRISEITDWYFNNIGDIYHNKYKFADLVSNDSGRVFALRNHLTNKDLDLDFNKDNMDITDSRALLLSWIKMRLIHDYTLTNIEMIKDIDAAKGKKDAVSGILLFHLLNTAAYISVMKELGFNMEELDLAHLAKTTNKALISFSEEEVYNREEYVDEVNHLIENAERIADKYLAEKAK